ncbi:M48 family metallopeptidase [Candidatus Micrarchaeota archaeon]|nr:M48 family metallopeptidase [Candidatus Micrarchaeota archaeon]
MIPVVDFKREVTNWSDDIGVTPKEIHVRSMRRKWASCSSKGRLTFSFDLLNESTNTRYKAIVHELLHLKYPNHGKMFKSLLTLFQCKKLRNR